ncbi:hypothetical protein OUZ56_008186 [Daphnia magna]|uniref:Uncharacterized protein n=1 Tax=Daphnia magna TaxID=35525 RepID=A0ABR0AC80_9CRUS|nr:hypothetical protein OUZ56_008186 [Daphnia magna]
MLGTHPPRERESASSVENEIKVIDRLPVASLVDTTPPRPTSVSHLSLQYFLLMDWGDVGGMSEGKEGGGSFPRYSIRRHLRKEWRA